MAIVIRYMCCLVFISRSSDLIQYGGIVTKANRGRKYRSLENAKTTNICDSMIKSVAVFSRASVHYTAARQSSFRKWTVIFVGVTFSIQAVQ